MDDNNRISPYSVSRSKTPFKQEEQYGASNILERFDYFDLMRILPEGNYTKYHIREVYMGNVMTMHVVFPDNEGFWYGADFRFHGDGLIDICAPLEDGYIVAKYDDHNWHLVNKAPFCVFNALMDSFVRELTKMNK